jgi:hypothetical protein
MRLIDGLSNAQRFVVVVALGFALGAVGSFLVSLGGGTGSSWLGYSPLGVSLLPESGLPEWLRLIIWLGLIGLWALTSIRVLRPSSGPATPD